MALKTITLCGELGEIRQLEDFFLFRFFPPEHEYRFGSDGDYLVSHGSSRAQRDFVKYRRADQVRIFIAGEAQVPDLNIFDYAMGFDRFEFGDRYVRLHPIIFQQQIFDSGRLLEPLAVKPAMPELFCDFVYSNRRAHPARDELFHALSRYLPVQSYGRHLNNSLIPEPVKSKASNWVDVKIELHKLHRFSIAAENAFYRGYTSEKIMTALLAGKVPIYWGNPDIGLDFNCNRFICAHEFASMEDLVERVKTVNDDKDLYIKICSEPALSSANLAEYQLGLRALSNLFEQVFNPGLEEAIRRGRGTFPTLYEDRISWFYRLDYRHEIAQAKAMTKSIAKKLRKLPHP